MNVEAIDLSPEEDDDGSELGTNPRAVSSPRSTRPSTALSTGGKCPLPSAPPTRQGSSAREKPTIKKELQHVFAGCVKIFVTRVSPSYTAPWRQGLQTKSTGSGFVLNREKRYIITNAHVVNEHTMVRIRKPVDPVKYRAKVLAISRETDLALLTVPEEAFWKGTIALSIREPLPMLDTDVVCLGYPKGADGMSITRGVVSRLSLQRTIDGGPAILHIQIDAAINSGNSGGPTVDKEGQVLGVSRATLTKAQNIGYIISTGVLQNFLHHYESWGQYRGTPRMLFRCQTLENPSLRKALKMPTDCRNGIRVVDTAPLCFLKNCIKKDDVLVDIDGHKMANDGTIPVSAITGCEARSEERISFQQLVSQRIVGEKLRLGILREGARMEAEVTLEQPDHLIPVQHGFDCWPSYFIVGGLVFVPLTRPYCKEAFKRRAMLPAMLKRMDEFKQYKGEQIIVLARILSHELNFGYNCLRNIIDSFNGVKLHNLAHLAWLVRHSKGEVYDFEAADGNRIVLNTQECAEGQKEIFAAHNITKQALNVPNFNPESFPDDPPLDTTLFEPPEAPATNE